VKSILEECILPELTGWSEWETLIVDKFPTLVIEETVTTKEML
jgi:hypothetical protein